MKRARGRGLLVPRVFAALGTSALPRVVAPLARVALLARPRQLPGRRVDRRGPHARVGPGLHAGGGPEAGRLDADRRLLPPPRRRLRPARGRGGGQDHRGPAFPPRHLQLRSKHGAARGDPADQPAAGRPARRVAGRGRAAHRRRQGHRGLEPRHPLDGSGDLPDRDRDRVLAGLERRPGGARDPRPLRRPHGPEPQPGRHAESGGVVSPLPGHALGGPRGPVPVPPLRRPRQQPRLVRLQPRGEPPHGRAPLRPLAAADRPRPPPDGDEGRADVPAPLHRSLRAQRGPGPGGRHQRPGHPHGRAPPGRGQDRGGGERAFRRLLPGPGLPAHPRRRAHPVGAGLGAHGHARSKCLRRARGERRGFDPKAPPGTSPPLARRPLVAARHRGLRALRHARPARARRAPARATGCATSTTCCAARPPAPTSTPSSCPARRRTRFAVRSSSTSCAGAGWRCIAPRPPSRRDGRSFPAGSHVVLMQQPCERVREAGAGAPALPEPAAVPGRSARRALRRDRAHPAPAHGGGGGRGGEAVRGRARARGRRLRPRRGHIEGRGRFYALGHKTGELIALGRLLRAGVAVRWATAWFADRGRDFPAGTLLVPASARAASRLSRASWGSWPRGVSAVPKPASPCGYRASALYQSWVPSMDEGWTRYVFEKQMGVPTRRSTMPTSTRERCAPASTPSFSPIRRRRRC